MQKPAEGLNVPLGMSCDLCFGVSSSAGAAGIQGVPSVLFGLLVVVIAVRKKRLCAVDGQGGLYVLLCGDGEGTEAGGAELPEPMAKQGLPCLRLCWEYPHLLSKNFPWGSK